MNTDQKTIPPSGADCLVAVSHIKALKARYCRYIDTKQWTRLQELFTCDAIFSGLGSAADGADVTAFIKGVSARLKYGTTIHRCNMPEIVLTGPSSARAVWAMEDYLTWTDEINLRETENGYGFNGFGYYEEEYRVENDEWKISFLRLTRLRIDPILHLPNVATNTSYHPSTDWLKSTDIPSFG